VLVIAHQQQLVPVGLPAPGRRPLHHGQRHAACIGAGLQRRDVDRGVEAQQRVALAGHDRVVERAAVLGSQRCGVRQPGTVEGVNSYIVYAGAASPS
jgi:hypothetical protein